MTKPIEITALDPILDKLEFKSYKNIVERRFERFYLTLENRSKWRSRHPGANL